MLPQDDIPPRCRSAGEVTASGATWVIMTESWVGGWTARQPLRFFVESHLQRYFTVFKIETTVSSLTIIWS